MRPMFGFNMPDFIPNSTKGTRNKILVQSLQTERENASEAAPLASGVTSTLQAAMDEAGASSFVYENQTAYGGRGMRRILTTPFAVDTCALVFAANFGTKSNLADKFTNKENDFWAPSSAQPKYVTYSLPLNEEQVKSLPKVLLYSGAKLQKVKDWVKDTDLEENMTFIEVDFKKEEGFKTAATTLIYECLPAEFLDGSTSTSTSLNTSTSLSDEEQVEGEGEIASPKKGQEKKKMKKKGAIRRFFSRMKAAVF